MRELFARIKADGRLIELARWTRRLPPPTPTGPSPTRSGAWRVIGLLCGGFPERDLRAAGCAAIYRDPEDLLRDYTALAELAPRRAA